MSKTFTIMGSCSSNSESFSASLRITTTASSATNNYSTVDSMEFIFAPENATSIKFSGLRLYIDDTEVARTTSATFSFAPGQPVVIMSTSGQTIAHAINGSKTASFRALVQATTTTGLNPGVIEVIGSQALETIDRCASISSIQINGTSTTMQSESTAMEVNGTNKPKVNWSQKVTNAGFTYKIQYFFQNTSSSAVSATSSPFSAIDVPTSWLSQIPTATVARGRVDLITYSGSTKIGTKSAYYYLKVPSYTPTANHSLTYNNQTNSANIQGKTSLNISASGSSSYGATITSYSTTVAGTAYAGSSVSSIPLNTSGTVSVVTTVTDSRGKTNSKTTNITVHAYSPPVITQFSGYRTASTSTSYVIDANGAYGFTWIAATYSTCGGANTATAKIVLNGNTTTVTGSNGSIGKNTNIVACSTASAFIATCTITDTVGSTVTATAVINPVQVPLNISKTGVGIGSSAPSAGLSIGYTNIGIGTTAPSSTGILISAAANPTTIQSTKIGIGCAAPSSGITIGTSSSIVEITKGGGLGYDYANGGVIFPATRWVPSKDNTYSLGSASKKWTTLQTTKINGVETATYLNNISFQRVPISSFSISSGIGTWTGATGATTGCFVRAMRGESLSSAGSSWYIPDAWCSAANTIKVIFQTSAGKSYNPTSGYVMVMWKSR